MRSLVLCLLIAGAVPVLARDDQYAPSGAHVRESEEAAFQIAKADAMAAAGNWEECLRLYLGVLDNPDWNQVLLGMRKEGEKNTRYAWAVAVVRRKLLHLPPEGRAVFRRIYDPKAQALFAVASASKDVAKLREIADTWFLTSVGADALWLLSRLYLEEGRPDLALPYLERLSGLAGDAPMPLVYARMAECYAMLGKADAIRALLASPGFPADARIVLGEGVVPLKEYLTALSVRPAPRAASPASAESWPALGGDATRNRAMGPDVSLPPKSWSAKVPPGATRHLGLYGFSDPSDEEAIPGGRAQVIPSVADGLVFLHNDIGVWAYNLVAGKSEPIWKNEVPISPSRVLPDSRVVHTTTVADGIVFTNLVNSVGKEREQLGSLVVSPPIPDRALCAFAERGGKLLWRLGGQALATELLLKASFAAAPAVENGRVFVGATYQKDWRDPIEHHVFCLDEKTGRVIWERYVGEGYLEMNLFNCPMREIVGSSVTLSADTVFYCTNLGILAALDKETGTPRWVDRYAQYRIPPTRELYVPPMPEGWENNPILLVGGTLVVAPTDSPYLYMVSAADGEDLRGGRLSREAGDGDPIAGMSWLLGAQGDRIVLAGPQGAVAIEMNSWKLKWRWKPQQGDPVVARGGLSRDQVFLPCHSGPQRIDIATGKILGRDAWPDPLPDAGNLVVVDNSVVTVSSSALSVFYSWEVLSAWLDQELARTPNDPQLRLRVARGLLQAGKAEEAVKHLERAMSLAAASGDPADARVAADARETLRRLYRDLGRAEIEAGKAGEAVSPLRKAVELSEEAADRAQGRCDLARALAACGRAGEAVAELSKVIAEDPDAPMEGGNAWEVARLAIASIVRKAGAQAYADQERAAGDRLSAAGDDEKKMEAVLRLFPNSRAAETASWRLAQVAEKQERWEDAAARLRAYLRDWPESDRFAQAHVDLAECYRKRGQVAKAKILLRQIARRIGSEKVTVDGKETTVDEYLARSLGASAPAAATSLPEVAWPVDTAWQMTEKNAETLHLLEVDGRRPEGAPALVLLAANAHLRAVDEATGEVRWSHDFRSEPQRCGWTAKALVVALQRDEVWALDPASGAPIWTCEAPGMLLSARFDEGAGYLLLADRANSAIQDLVAIDTRQGKRKWGLPLGQRQAGSSFWLTEDSLLVLTTSRQGRALLVVDRDSGEVARAIPIETSVGQVMLLASDQVAMVTGDRNEDLRVYEVSSGKMLWMASSRGLDTRTLRANGLQVACVAEDDDRVKALFVWDIETGKRTAKVPIGTPDYVTGAAIDDQCLYVSFREAAGQNRSIYLRAFSLADGATAWKKPLVAGEQYVAYPLLVTRGAVVAPTPMENVDDPENPCTPVFTAISTKDGEVEQQTRMPQPGRATLDVSVRDGEVLIVQGNHLYGMRHPAEAGNPGGAGK